ncbi:nuclear transport factor 2 family protein [Mycolicibacterium sp. XJ1904]
MSRESVVRAAFADIDAMKVDSFVARMSEDVVFQFGNAETVVGRSAVRTYVAQFFSTIDGLGHDIKNIWDVGNTTIVQMDVEYLRIDGRAVSAPAANILTYDGDLACEWRVYVDLTPLYVEQ